MADLTAFGREVLASQAFSRLVGTHIVSLTERTVELHLPIHENLTQQHGFVHGGVVSYLADNALTFAGGVALGGEGIVTAEMKINYIRPATGTMLIARAEAIGVGKSQAVARCDIFAVSDEGEKLCAAAQGTIARLQKA